jgi:hypothetical protein
VTFTDILPRTPCNSFHLLFCAPSVLPLDRGWQPIDASRVSGVGPGDGDLADVGVEPERRPDGRGRVDDVVPAAAAGVALVHDLGEHGAPRLRARDADHPEAPAAPRVPPRGQRRQHEAVVVVPAVALRRPAAGLAALEPVHRHHRRGLVGGRPQQQDEQHRQGRELGARHCSRPS